MQELKKEKLKYEEELIEEELRDETELIVNINGRGEVIHVTDMEGNELSSEAYEGIYITKVKTMLCSLNEGLWRMVNRNGNKKWKCLKEEELKEEELKEEELKEEAKLIAYINGCGEVLHVTDMEGNELKDEDYDPEVYMRITKEKTMLYSPNGHCWKLVGPRNRKRWRCRKRYCR